MPVRILSPARVSGVLLAVGALLWVAAGPAANVPDLYAARVPVAGSASTALDDAFARALAEVLVKVTGQRNAGADPASRRVLANPAALVRQYQQLPGGFLRVQFDPAALRGRLDAADRPVWAEDRPLVLAWVSVDGAGSSPVLTAAGPGSEAVALPNPQDPGATLRADLLTTAAARGIPLLLPAAEWAAGSGADQLSEAAAVSARERTGAAAVLMGLSVPTGGPALRRWVLLLGEERFEWPGDASDGINGTADRLAARYATTASAARQVRLRVSGIDSFEGYGRLQSYLRTVGLIQAYDIERVANDGIIYDLRVRGDNGRLRDAFALRRVIEPAADGAPVAGSPGDFPIDLNYRLVPVQ